MKLWFAITLLAGAATTWHNVTRPRMLNLYLDAPPCANPVELSLSRVGAFNIPHPMTVWACTTEIDKKE